MTHLVTNGHPPLPGVSMIHKFAENDLAGSFCIFFCFWRGGGQLGKGRASNWGEDASCPPSRAPLPRGCTFFSVIHCSLLLLLLYLAGRHSHWPVYIIRLSIEANRPHFLHEPLSPNAPFFTTLHPMTPIFAFWSNFSGEIIKFEKFCTS